MVWYLWLIVSVLGYIAVMPPAARIMYLVYQSRKDKNWRFQTGGRGALGLATIWPLALPFTFLVWVFAPPKNPRNRSIITWIESDSLTERRAARRKAIEAENRRLLERARAEGLPVDFDDTRGYG